MDIKEAAYIDILTKISCPAHELSGVACPLITTIEHAFLTDIRGHWPQQVSFLWSHATKTMHLAELCDCLTLAKQGATLVNYDQPRE